MHAVAGSCTEKEKFITITTTTTTRKKTESLTRNVKQGDDDEGVTHTM